MSVNMEKFEGKWSRPKTGDVFEIRIGGYRCPGRVVSTEAKPLGKGAPDAPLVYLFHPVSPQWEFDQREVLQVTNLLVSPIMTNLKPWTLKYFRTLGNVGFADGERLERHCFRSSFGRFYDEQGNEIQEPVSPVGTWGLHSFRTIDDALSEALGIPLAPD
ncbi:hypothetical protein RPIT_10665 [Tessaracoccus flavus]|uniref:Uncharacterized protein n=2 Tax=Tessaracoccus flavus TaxID=1610493 RepID=A0A1Q2CGL3_9ACTN|nr:hypothetical protein RPIT_10665 [Tessaracoccus flavus]SDY53289.1 hypothetical protein SAMN05428934_102172 [Tessaracoccus flavus]